MSFTEPERHRLHQALEDKLGPDEANTLMANLPPFAWTDIATKADLSTLRDDLTRHLDASLTEFRGDMHLKFAAMDEKFSARLSEIDARFVAVDSRFTSVDARFTSVDARFTAVQSQIAAVESQIAAVDSRITNLAADVRVSMADLRSEMHRGTLVVVGSLGSLMALLAAASNLFG